MLRTVRSPRYCLKPFLLDRPAIDQTLAECTVFNSLQCVSNLAQHLPIIVCFLELFFFPFIVGALVANITGRLFTRFACNLTRTFAPRQKLVFFCQQSLLVLCSPRNILLHAYHWREQVRVDPSCRRRSSVVSLPNALRHLIRCRYPAHRQTGTLSSFVVQGRFRFLTIFLSKGRVVGHTLWPTIVWCDNGKRSSMVRQREALARHDLLLCDLVEGRSFSIVQRSFSDFVLFKMPEITFRRCLLPCFCGRFRVGKDRTRRISRRIQLSALISLRRLADVGQLVARKVVAEPFCLGCIQVQRVCLPDEMNIDVPSPKASRYGAKP